MKITLTEFQRNFRKAREAADRGDSVVVTGENDNEYVFERRLARADHPFERLEGVFGAVNLPQDRIPLREKIRRRLSAKNGGRRRRIA